MSEEVTVGITRFERVPYESLNINDQFIILIPKFQFDNQEWTPTPEQFLKYMKVKYWQLKAHDLCVDMISGNESLFHYRPSHCWRITHAKENLTTIDE